MFEVEAAEERPIFRIMNGVRQGGGQMDVFLSNIKKKLIKILKGTKKTYFLQKFKKKAKNSIAQFLADQMVVEAGKADLGRNKEQNSGTRVVQEQRVL